jgi:hypothetical protein
LSSRFFRQKPEPPRRIRATPASTLFSANDQAGKVGPPPDYLPGITGAVLFSNR